MTADVLSWPCREPGRPYRWVLSLDARRPAPTCLAHRLPTDGLGVCFECVAEWRAGLGADPDHFAACRVCAYPLHPAVESAGWDTCPTCDPGVAVALAAVAEVEEAVTA
jgi:hypothetical protein